MENMMYNKKVTFFALVVAICMMICATFEGREALAAEFPYYGTLDIEFRGWKDYSTGINYNLTGGTAGSLKQGAKLKVLNEQKNASGYMVSYCYSEDLGRYCYVSSRYIVREEENTKGVPSLITQKMEAEYGIDYYRLFDEAPGFLVWSAADAYEAKCLEYCRDIFDKQDKSIGISVFWEVLANGRDIIWNELFAARGYSKSAEEKFRMEAARHLLKALCDNDEAGFLSEVSSNANDIKDVVEWLNVAGKIKEKELVSKLKKAYRHVPEAVIEELVEKQFDISALDSVSEAVAIAKEVLITLDIYTVELNTLEKLQGYVEPTTQLYQDLELVKGEIEKDPFTHIMNYGTTEVIKGVSEQMFEEILDLIGGGVSLGINVVTMVSSIIQNGIDQGTDIDEYVKTAYLMHYYWELSDVVSQMRSDVIWKNTEVSYEYIADYEEVYFIKNRALHAVLEYCKSIEGKSKYNDLLSADIVRYENYIRACVKNYRAVRKKITLDVPLYTQKHTYSCGVSNVKMILDYLNIQVNGKSISEDTLWNWANLDNEGTYVYRVAQTLRKYGAPYQYVSVKNDTTENYWNRLESSLRAGYPVIVQIWPEKNDYWKYSSGHYVLVTGIYVKEDNTPYVIINDCHFKYGEQGKEMPLDELLRANKRHSSYLILGK